MKIAEVTLESVSPYSQSKHYVVDKLPGELDRDYEKRTWRERCHTSPDGHIQIPPMACTNSLKEAARYLSISIPGKGTSKYTKNFDAGILVTDPLVLPIKKDDVKGEWFFVPSDGKRGGAKRVEKCFSIIPSWKGKILYNILEMKFIEGRKVRDVASRLAMSEADLYRKQRVAVEVVAKAILEMEVNLKEP